MITVYEKPSDGGSMVAFAMEAESGDVLLLRPGVMPMVRNKEGRVICSCEQYLNHGYCAHMETLDTIQFPEYGFQTREIPKAVIRDHATDIAWVLTDGIHSVRDGKCKCLEFRTKGTCHHASLAKS